MKEGLIVRLLSFIRATSTCTRMFVVSVHGAHFTNNFWITIQIWWEFHYTLIQFKIKWSLQNVAHVTTAVLSWHVRNFAAIRAYSFELQVNAISIQFELRKIVSEMGPWPSFLQESSQVQVQVHRIWYVTFTWMCIYISDNEAWLCEKFIFNHQSAYSEKMGPCKNIYKLLNLRYLNTPLKMKYTSFNVCVRFRISNGYL